jgi:hypothetical protein
MKTNQKQEWPVAAMFVNGSEINEQFFRGPSKDASYQVVVHLVRLTDNAFCRDPLTNMGATGNSYF